MSELAALLEAQRRDLAARDAAEPDSAAAQLLEERLLARQEEIAAQLPRAGSDQLNDQVRAVMSDDAGSD